MKQDKDGNIIIRDFRCCMCPAGFGETVPAEEHPDGKQCNFILRFMDSRGWIYFVRSGIGGDTFKTFYRKPNKPGDHGCHNLPWRGTFDGAQADLNRLAQEKGWIQSKTIGKGVVRVDRETARIFHQIQDHE